MDPYAEAVVAGTEPSRRREMEVHLHACPACFQEVESLVALLREEAGD
jgi:anti-sigma factor RsiW